VIFQVADAEALPFADESYDAVLSTFGVMFAPDQATAAELARVCRRGGRIGLANWTPEGFVGQMFKVLGRHCHRRRGPAAVELGHRSLAAYAISTIANFCCRSPGAPSISVIARRAFHRHLPSLVRAGAQGLRGAAAGKRSGAGE
jgi:SAM-dependent methyltransferase